MAKVDSLKEEIGWLAQNYDGQSAFLMVVGLFSVIIMTGGVVWMSRTAYRRIDELGGA